MAINDIYQINMVTRYKTETYCNNVFYFRQISGATNAADDLVSAFVTDIQTLVRALVSPTQTWSEYRATNLFNLADAVVQPIGSGVAGTNVGSPMPSFVSGSIKFPRTLALMRNGYKRFTGIPETSVTDGQIVSTELTKWQTLATRLTTPINAGVGFSGSFQHCIVHRIPYTTDSGSQAYRLPRFLGEALYYDTLSAVAVLDVTSQNSRKLGRGI